MAKTTLKVTSAFMLGGRMRTPGDVVRADDRTARDLIRRGKAQQAEATADTADDDDDDDDDSAAEQPEKGSAKKGGAGAAKPKADAAGDT